MPPLRFPNLRGIPRLLETLFDNVRNIGRGDNSLIPQDRGLTPSKTLGAQISTSPEPVIPSPSPEPQAPDLESIIRSGFENFSNPAPPIATMSGELAELGRNLPPTIDPRFPAVLALMESRGLLDPTPARTSNPFNIMSGGGPVQYPDPRTAILGGNGKLGLAGLLREGGLYQDFRDTGDLSLFFDKFTPSSDPLNPSNQELVDRANILLELFPELATQ